MEKSRLSTSDFSVRIIKWYWGVVFTVVWLGLFYAAVIPSYYYFPKFLTKEVEDLHKNEFIGERAEDVLRKLTSFGVKPIGSSQHLKATEYLYEEVESIRNSSRLDLYDIEIDKQIVSGKFNGIDKNNFKIYQDIVNIIVRVRPIKKKSDLNVALLINSHYDSEVGSPGAGDAGVMIAIMTELLRKITSHETPLEHTLIFLLNGGEENGLLGSHGFVSSHLWAQDVRAVINLDSAGSGGKELLFQSGPNNPWLMKYYKQSILCPFASTIAEELFQNKFIPSDTDFRVFRDYGKIPGLDFAHSYNGYVYHTKYDRFGIIMRGTYQSTGSNLLALIRNLANAPELEDTKAYEEGHTVFYDFGGWYLVFYTESQGIIINALVSVISIALVPVFIISAKNEYGLIYDELLKVFGYIFVTQLVSVFIAVALDLMIASFMHAVGLSLSWFNSKWMLVGLYFCPVFFVLGMGQSLLSHYGFNRKIPLKITTQMMMHSHSIILVLILFFMMSMGIRSAFVVMISIFFFMISVIINFIIDRFYKHDILWTIPHCLCQLIPFWFHTYLCFAFLQVFIPMTGRSGASSANNPDLTIASFIEILALLFAGFLIPLLNLCRRSKMLIAMFGIISIVTIIIAATPAAFPFAAEVAPQRFDLRHTNRVFYDYEGNVKSRDSGYSLIPQATRYSTVDGHVKYFDKRLNMETECATKIFCGTPIFVDGDQDFSYFIPGPEPVLPDTLTVELLERSINGNRRKFKIQVIGSDHTIIVVDFKPETKLINWNVGTDASDIKFNPPYIIRTTYGLDKKSVVLDMEFETTAPPNSTVLYLVATSHYVHHENYFTEDFRDISKSFPIYTYLNRWIADYQSFEF